MQLGGCAKIPAWHVKGAPSASWQSGSYAKTTKGKHASGDRKVKLSSTGHAQHAGVAEQETCAAAPRVARLDRTRRHSLEERRPWYARVTSPPPEYLSPAELLASPSNNNAPRANPSPLQRSSSCSTICFVSAESAPRCNSTSPSTSAPTPINSPPRRPRLSLPGGDSRKLPCPSPVDATSIAEFEMLGRLGEGGFGRVEHVRRKHDGAEFALKQVPLPHSSNLTPELAAVAAREVMNEPRLHMLLGQHPNIVHCHGYWLERLQKTDGDAPVVGATPARLPWLQRHGVLGRADSFTELSPCSVSEWSAASSGVPPSPIRSPAAAAAAAAASSADVTRPHGKWTLCILLELCGCTPLSRWLREHPPTVERAEQIFVQVLRGLAHVHSRHVVHCDLKPGNMFFARGSSVVKTGDFGLARRSTSAARAEGRLECVGVGTPTYAAPEQQRGEVTCASDMFSIGIILYELLQPFSTAMERGVLLGAVRRGEMPSAFVRAFPFHSSCIRRLVDLDPSQRPSAHALLRSVREFSATRSSPSLWGSAALADAAAAAAEEEADRRRSEAIPAASSSSSSSSTTVLLDHAFPICRRTLGFT